GRVDEVLAQRLDHRRAHDARLVRELAGGHRDDGQHHVLEGDPRLAVRALAPGREPAERDRENDDQQHPEPEVRDGEQPDRETRDARVEPASAGARGDRPQDDPTRGGEHERGHREGEGGAHPAEDDVQNRLGVGGERIAEVPGEHVAEVDEVARPGGPVEPVGRDELLAELLGERNVADERLNRVSGRELEQEEQDRDDGDEEDERRQQQAAVMPKPRLHQRLLALSCVVAAVSWGRPRGWRLPYGETSELSFSAACRSESTGSPDLWPGESVAVVPIIAIAAPMSLRPKIGAATEASPTCPRSAQASRSRRTDASWARSRTASSGARRASMRETTAGSDWNASRTRVCAALSSRTVPTRTVSTTVPADASSTSVTTAPDRPRKLSTTVSPVRSDRSRMIAGASVRICCRPEMTAASWSSSGPGP